MRAISHFHPSLSLITGLCCRRYHTTADHQSSALDVARPRQPRLSTPHSHAKRESIHSDGDLSSSLGFTSNSNSTSPTPIALVAHDQATISITLHYSFPYSFPYSLQIMSPVAHRYHAARSLLFSILPRGTFSPTEYLAIYLFVTLQRPLSPRLSSRSTGHVTRRIIACLTFSCAPPTPLCYLHVLRPLRTYRSVAIRLCNNIVAFVSLIVTEVGLVQGAQLRRPLDFGAVTTRQFSLPLADP